MTSIDAQPGPSSASERQLPIILTTRLPTLSIPVQPYLVPVSWRRSHLSTLVNRLLNPSSSDASQPKAIPFDFIIDGELLRGDLDSYLASKGLTEESALNVEYVRSTLPPKYQGEFQHEDWIASVDMSRSGRFLTASYDGNVRIFTSASSEPLLTHRAAPSSSCNPSLTSAQWASEGQSHIATTSMDGVLRLFSLDTDGETYSTPTLLSASTPYDTPTPSPLSSVVISGDNVVTAGWDGAVSVWTLSSLLEATQTDAAEPVSKRRKAIRSKTGHGPTLPNVKPRHIYWHVLPVASASADAGPTPGSNARIGGLAASSTNLYSAAWEGSVKEWDTSVDACTSTKATTLQHLCASRTVTPSSLLTGSFSRQISLFDFRDGAAQERQTSLAIPGAHSAPVSSLAAHPTSPHLFASGSYDGVVKLWDLRSPKGALFTMPGKPLGEATDANGTAPGAGSTNSKKNAVGGVGAGQKVLCIDWDRDGQIVGSGGEDGVLVVHRGEGIGSGVEA